MFTITSFVKLKNNSLFDINVKKVCLMLLDILISYFEPFRIYLSYKSLISIGNIIGYVNNKLIVIKFKNKILNDTQNNKGLIYYLSNNFNQKNQGWS